MLKTLLPSETLKDLLFHEYGLSEALSYRPFTDGTFGAAFVETAEGKFALKHCDQKELLELYDVVQHHLHQNNICQPRIIRTVQGALFSTGGFALYEFLEGELSYHPTLREQDSFINYLARYNAALSKISPPLWLNEIRNNFDRARSWQYLSTELYPNLSRIDLPTNVRDLFERTFEKLSEFASRTKTKRVDSQLVHIDPSPGNILYHNGDTVSLLDFTPAIESHLYSFCVFCCYHYILLNRSSDTQTNILRAFDRYQRAHDLDRAGHDLLYSTLIEVQATGAFIPLVFVLRNEQMPWTRIRAFDPNAVDALSYVLELGSTIK